MVTWLEKSESVVEGWGGVWTTGVGSGAMIGGWIWGDGRVCWINGWAVSLEKLLPLILS